MAHNFQTFGSVVDDTYAEAGVDSGNQFSGASEAQVASWANRYSKIFLEKVKLKTQDDTYGFRTKSDDALSDSAANSGDTSVTTATSNATLGYPSTGAVLLDGLPYTYSAFSTTTMTISALDRNHANGDIIQAGYAVPSDFGKPRALFLDGGSDTYPLIKAVQYELIKWGTFDRIPANHYAVWNDFIFLPEGTTSASDATLHYYAKGANTLSTSDTMEIYQMWDSYVIFKGTARIHRLLRDFDQAQTYENLAKEVMMQAKTQVGEEDISPNRGFTPGW